MAGSGNGQQFNPSFLTQNQQDLLMAALVSNQPDKTNQFYAGEPLTNGATFDYNMGTLDPSMFLSSGQTVGNFDMNGLDNQQFMDLMDSNANSIDFGDSFDPNSSLMDDTADPSALELGDDDLHDDLHDKRKSPEDQEDAEPKRREGDDKTAKKPGRKPLTTEPTTKRKAQNRAAQRAFRERKEKHLKDLETKVEELEKASESANHENGLLRAQVQRLQMELREYRKRLSLQSTLGRSPPLGGLQSTMISNAGDANAAFQFAFPKFGSLPSIPMTGQAPGSTTSPPATNGLRHGSSDGRASPKSQARASLSSMGSPSKASESQTGASPAFSTMFGTPSSDGAESKVYNIFSAGNTDAQSSNQSTSDSSASASRIFQFNSGSSNSNSPSVSSISQYGNGASSSCGTSPEPSHNSPAAGNKDSQLDTINENGYTCHTGADGEVSFCEKLNMACGNIRDPTPRVKSISNSSPAPAVENADSNKGGVGGIDYFATQNGGQFDPVLFGDFRESNTAIVGDGDFTGGFFNDAMPSMDWSSPVFNWNDLTGSSLEPTGLTPAVQKTNPLEQADALVSGMDDDEVVPGEDTTKMLSCHKIWDKLQDRDDFKQGNLDIDGLCNELRSKARCSESGVVIDQKDVDAALQRLPASRQNSGSDVTQKA